MFYGIYNKLYDFLTSHIKVVWRKLPMAGPLTVGTKTWVKDQRVHVEHMPNSDQWNLIIERVDLNDSATYECQVSFRSKKMRQLITLTVIGNTVIFSTTYPKIQNTYVTVSSSNRCKYRNDVSKMVT